MTTYTPTAKNVTSYSASPRLVAGSMMAGTPIGLLLTLTQSGDVSLTTYTPVTKNTTSYSTINKN